MMSFLKLIVKKSNPIHLFGFAFATMYNSNIISAKNHFKFLKPQQKAYSERILIQNSPLPVIVDSHLTS